MKKFSVRPFLSSVTALLVTAFALTAAVPARADLHPAMSVRPVDDQVLAKAGVSQRYSVVITAAEDLDLEGIEITGPGWVISSIDAPALLSLRKGESATVTFTATTSQPDEQVVLTAYVGSREVSMGIDLSPGARRFLEGAQPGQQLDVEMPIPTIDPSAITPVPMPPAPDHPQATGPEETENKGFLARAARNIRIRGQIAYLRDDGALLPADNCTVELWENDVDPNPDDYIATFATNSLGNFDFTFFWDAVSEAEPDLYIVYSLDSGRTRVTSTGGGTYAWGSTTWQDYTGTDLQMGIWSAGDPAQYPAFHLFTNLQRTWRYINDRGWDAPKVTGVWPDAGAPTGYYTNNEIHMSAGVQWEEDTISHEWGHHWAASFATATFDTYCNGTCDANPALGQCGWCMWCGETERVAWNEGIASLFGDLCPEQWGPIYGQAPIHATDIYETETLKTCSGTLANPILDAGHTTALLRDIVDSTNDDHPQYPGTDSLALGWTQVLTSVDLDVPQTPFEFLTRFNARYPQYFAQLNSTAQNCGFADVVGPTNLAGLGSPSHGNGAWSTDTTIDVTWVEPTDVWSGTSQYAIGLNNTAGVFPGWTPNLGDVTSWTSGPQLTGEYWFSIFPFDRAGNGSSVYWWQGPFRVIGSDGPNLQPTAGTWPYAMVPRATADASVSSASAPTTLPGNTTSTYLNAKRANTGGVATVGSGHTTRHYIDGVQLGSNFLGGTGIAAGTILWEQNQGPYNVRGGRHTVHMTADVNNTEPELVETDNQFGRQWIWSPTMPSAGTLFSQTAPPIRTAGHSSVPAGSQTLRDNVDGLRLGTSGDYWDVLVINPGASADYDLVGFTTLTTGATSGFEGADVFSTRGGGRLDALVANRNKNTAHLDVGILNFSGSSASVNVMRVTAPGSVIVLGDPATTFVLDAANPLRMREIYTDIDRAGRGTMYVQTDPPTANVEVRWFGSGTQFDGMTGADLFAVTNGQGVASVPLTGTTLDDYSMVMVSRDPIIGTSPVTVTLKLRDTMQATVLAAPAAEVSLFSAPDGSGRSFTEAYQWDGVPGSPVQVVDATLQVRVVDALTNNPVVGFPAADIVLSATGVNGCVLGLTADGNTDANGVATFSTPLHTGGATTVGPLGITLVDVPSPVVTGVTNVRVNSPDLDANRSVDLADLGLFAFYVFEGYDYRGDFNWDGTINLIDVGLFSSKFGISCPPNGATVGATEPDLADLRDQLRLHFDEQGLSSHVAVRPGETVTAYLSLEGPAAHEGIRGWEASLETSSNVRILGTQLASKGLDIGSGADHIVGTAERLRAESGSLLRLMTVQLTVTDDAPASVWIRGSSVQSLGVDLPTVAVGDDENLELRPVSGSVDGGTLPAATLNDGSGPQIDVPLRGEVALRNAPNPFNPATEILFELPRKGSTSVRIYDAAGRLVRELGGQVLDSGPHALTWNGTDLDGRGVVSGVYFYRLYFDGQPLGEPRRMTLVK